MKKGIKNISLIQIFRLLVQVVFFIFLPALFIQALNGIKQIYLATMNQSFSMELLPQLVEIIALIPLTILFGRFFCGWMCGFGSFTDFIYIVSGKLFKRKYSLNEPVDAVLKYVKYVLLVVLAVFAWSLNLSIFNSLSPWDVFGMIAIVGKVPDFGFVISNLLVAFVILIFIIVGCVFIERFFCRYLCPMGAVFAITSILRIGKIKKTREKCGKCMICTNNCAMGIPLYKMDVVKSVECISCMKCISACPRHNTSYTIAKKDVKPLLISAVSVAFMTGSYYAANYVMNSSGNSITTTQEDQTSSTNTLYTDGTYEGSGTGFRGTTKVSVTIKNDKITTVTTISYKDDKQYYNRAFSTVTSKIVSSQSSTVDAVSGATYSSKGIMEAVTNALSQAKITASSTEDATLSALAQETTTQTATTATTATTVTKAATATTATTTATSDQYTDGTYTGTGTGFRGATKVSVVVSGGKITTITTVSYKDDKQYYNRAFTTVSNKIISSQSSAVDSVSGATYSSKGIMAAVDNALSGALK